MSNSCHENLKLLLSIRQPHLDALGLATLGLEGKSFDLYFDLGKCSAETTATLAQSQLKHLCVRSTGRAIVLFFMSRASFTMAFWFDDD